MTTNLLTPQQLHDYQRVCVTHQLQHPDSMLWLGTGLGKTPITLTTIVDRMRAGLVQKTLIFGPLRVIQAVWARESRKWTHTKHLRFSIIHGTREKRSRALFADADIYLINYENMNWLAEQLDRYYVSQGKPLPFQMVVYDEVSKLKNSTALRVAGGKRDRKDKRGKPHTVHVTGWRRMIDLFKYRTGLTATPASNGYIDLHGQFLAVDGGERLGPRITHYRDSYFVSDYNGWSYAPTALGKQWIEHKISDITVKMDSRDYLDLPDCKVTNIMVDLPAAARRAYKEIERDLFTQLDSGKEVEVFSKSSVSNKCLQFCNGSPYLISGESGYEALHDAKLDALEEVLEEAGGSPVLCSYTFKPDAERIANRFKKYKPVNLTATPSKDTEKVINRWNRGEIKLMLGHPACLHPATQVLTELRGWVNLIDVKQDDRVFDGVEFVSHKGCSYSGYKNTIELFGVVMTPKHKLLIGNEWKEASDVGNHKDIREKALYQYQGDDQYLSEMFTLRGSVRNTAPECDETQSNEKEELSALCTEQLSQNDRHKNMENMARNETPRQESIGQRLCRSWDRNVYRMGELYKVLRGYAHRLCEKSYNRKERCQQTIHKGQLYMGDSFQTARQQTYNPARNLSRCVNAPSRTMSCDRSQQDDVNHASESRDDCRRGGFKRKEFHLREGSESKEKSHVYDLVDCGPRHQFVIRNNEGDVFISHNSMGHGVDGLQQAGHILVWFGANWSLELTDQMRGRLDRQGQTHPVSIIRILCNDTVDLAVVDALERKNDSQEGLKAALQRYRDGRVSNDLEVNFY